MKEFFRIAWKGEQGIVYEDVQGGRISDEIEETSCWLDDCAEEVHELLKDCPVGVYEFEGTSEVKTVRDCTGEVDRWIEFHGEVHPTNITRIKGW